MPNYDVSTVASEIKPPQATSLGDMVNMARGAQAYQQAAQVNPLKLQQEQTATEQAKFNLQQVKADKAKGLATSLLASKNWINPEKMDHEFEFVERTAKNQGLDDENGALQQIKDEYKKQGPEAAYQKLYQMTYGRQAPSTQFEAAGKVTAPSLPGAQPTQAAPQTPSQPTQAQPVPELSQPVAPVYPVRKAGEPYALGPSEAADKDQGFTHRDTLIKRQSQLTTERRNIDEVIKSANELEKSWAPTSGILGSAYRHVATWAGDPTYLELSKNLAQAQISNMKALGLSTDADKNLIAAAQGNYTYPPEILMKIANRAKADMRNIDMQATAADKYSRNNGDNNMKSFQQMWNKNADSKVFEIMNLAEDTNLNAEEKKKVVDSLLGKDPKQREIFNQKYQNILKLQQTGSL